jgi:hypothetical protein
MGRVQSPDSWHHWTPHRVPEGYVHVRVALDIAMTRVGGTVTLLGCQACGSLVWNVEAHNALCEYGKGGTDV